jgi:hypothetical protein
LKTRASSVSPFFSPVLLRYATRRAAKKILQTQAMVGFFCRFLIDAEARHLLNSKNRRGHGCVLLPCNRAETGSADARDFFASAKRV